MKALFFAATAALCWSAAAAVPLAAQSLSRIDVIALQQQLRDDGCGVMHVSGRLDAITRRALKKCASKYNASGTDAAAVLAAMNIGFGANDKRPSVAEARSGALPVQPSSGSMGGMLPETPTPTPTPNTPSIPSTPSTPEPSTPPVPPTAPPVPPSPPTTPNP